MEADLITRSLQGDLEAFNHLVEQYQAMVYNLAYRMLGDQSAAEDAAQDTFISAYRALHRFRGDSFKSWLLTITANACRDALRRRKRRREGSLDEILEISDAWFPAPDPSPEEAVLSAETQREVHEALQQLNPDHRLAIVLVDLQGQDYAEAARVMGVSLGTVKSRLSRARGQLRQALLKRRGTLQP